MIILYYIFFYLISLAYGTLPNVGIENVSDQIVINANQLIPLTIILRNSLKAMTGILPERRNLANHPLVASPQNIPLVEMVHSDHLCFNQITHKIALNLKKHQDLSHISEQFLGYVNEHFELMTEGNIVDYNDYDKMKSEFLLQCIYSFVKLITQKCLQFFNNEPTELWAGISKSFISQVTPVPNSKLRVVYSQFCIAQSDGFKPVLGEWRVNFADNSFNKVLNQKIRIQFSSEMGQSHNSNNNEMNEVPIILITRYRKGFNLRKKSKFFNVVIDGTEISYTKTTGIILTKIDEIWPKGKYIKQAFCGKLKTIKIEKIQKILDSLSSTIYAYNSPRYADNNEFTETFIALLASDGGENQLNEIRRDWFSGKKMLGFDFEKCKV